MLLQPFVIVALALPVNGEPIDIETILFAAAVVVTVLIGSGCAWCGAELALIQQKLGQAGSIYSFAFIEDAARHERCGIDWDLGALGQTVVARHGAHSQAIVSKDSSPPFCLARAVFGLVSPILYGFLIPPKRKRQQLFRVGQTLETLESE